MDYQIKTLNGGFLFWQNDAIKLPEKEKGEKIMRKKMQALLKNEKGLTLVELLAVIVILGIIAAIAIPSIANIIDNSKKDAHVANAEQMIGAARLAVAANEKGLWAGVADATNHYDASINITMQELADTGYLESVIEDPDAAGTSYNTTTSYVRFNETTKTYSIFLDGSKRDVEGTTNNSAVLATDLSRTSVK